MLRRATAAARSSEASRLILRFEEMKDDITAATDGALHGKHCECAPVPSACQLTATAEEKLDAQQCTTAWCDATRQGGQGGMREWFAVDDDEFVVEEGKQSAGRVGGDRMYEALFSSV